MNDYEERVEARRLKLSTRALTLRRQAEAVNAAAREMAEVIPFGQPILVGHHSEKRDRRFRGRIAAKFDKSAALYRTAEQLEERAKRVGRGGISSDDPDAIAKLEAKLARLVASQETMKSANRLVRKNDRVGLAALGYAEVQIGQLFTPDFMGRIGFPDFALKNNNARIRDIKERIERLKSLQAAPVTEPIVGEGWTITEDLDDNRVLITFAERTDKAQYARLRSHGFVWSPSRGAFVRKRSAGAIYAARQAVQALH